jgi:hypothetical protein
MAYLLVANEPMQRWTADAAAFPRAVPARLRGLLDEGLVERDGGMFFAAQLPVPDKFEALKGHLDATGAIEWWINEISMSSLKPVRRTIPGTEEWIYECVAIAVAFGEAVLDAAAALSERVIEVVVSVEFGEDVEQPSSTFRFGTVTDGVGWSRHPDEYEQAVFSMRRAV